MRKHPGGMWVTLLAVLTLIFVVHTFPTVLRLFGDSEGLLDIKWDSRVGCDTNLLHIVIPLQSTSADYLTGALESIQSQSYRHFKLWLIKDSKTNADVAQIALTVRKSQSPEVVQALHIDESSGTGDTLYRAFPTIRTYAAPNDIVVIWNPAYAMATSETLETINRLYGSQSCLSSWGPMTKYHEEPPYPVSLKNPLGSLKRSNVAEVVENAPLSFRFASWDFMYLPLSNFSKQNPTWSAEQFHQYNWWS